MTHTEPPTTVTIAAIATGPSAGAVGIVRVSGPAVAQLITQICRCVLQPRQAQVCRFYNVAGQPVDHGIALFFPAPHSYTGEDVLELQGHGGVAVLQSVLQACLGQNSPEWPIRLAEPGEFTKRAFLNHKLDLLQAQAVADVIEAGSQQAVRAAVASLTGGFSRAVQSLQHALTGVRMRVEACLDFPEEEDVDLLSEQAIDQRLRDLTVALDAVLRASRRGLALKQGLKIALIGPPNVGKSSLLNALAEEEVAIVTPIAGTTRDRITQEIQIEGLRVQIMDTAGIRETGDLVEQEGVARSWQAIDAADLVLLLADASQTPNGLQAADRILVSAVAHRLALGDDKGAEASGVQGRGRPLWQVHTKVDLLSEVPPALDEGVFWLSAKTGVGLDRLRDALKAAAGLSVDSEGDVFSARTWHLETLHRVGECLQRAQAHLSIKELELLAEQLRLAQNLLSELTGELLPDDLLGVIFSQFCIGK
jgi:tRNA modification GTPase